MLDDAVQDQMITGYSVLAEDQALTPGAAGVFAPNLLAVGVTLEFRTFLRLSRAVEV